MVVRVIAAAGLFVASLTAAQAESMAKGSAGGWNIFANPANNGCFMEQQQGDMVVQMGTLGSPNLGYVALYGASDDGIEQDQEMPFILSLDGELFDGTATGVQRGDIQGAYVVANNPDFGAALAGKQTMTVNPDTENSIDVDLTGTMEAMPATVACHNENFG